MAINQNHLFEDLDGVKCSIVEKNVSKERVGFLQRILEYNRFTVVIVPSPPPKAASPAAARPSVPVTGPGGAPASAAVPAASVTSSTGQTVVPAPAPVTNSSDQASAPVTPLPVPAAPVASPPDQVVAPPPPPETFTVGVTDVLFNPVNAIFGRLLKAPGGHTVTLAYWQQKESTPDDETPYFDARY